MKAFVHHFMIISSILMGMKDVWAKSDMGSVLLFHKNISDLGLSTQGASLELRKNKGLCYLKADLYAEIGTVTYFFKFKNSNLYAVQRKEYDYEQGSFDTGLLKDLEQDGLIASGHTSASNKRVLKTNTRLKNKAEYINEFKLYKAQIPKEILIKHCY